MSGAGPQPPPSPERTLARRWLGPCGLPVCDASTFGITCYAADRLWYDTRFPAVAWMLVMVLWMLASGAVRLWNPARGDRPGTGLLRGLGLIAAAGACACALKTLAAPFSWGQASAFGILLLAALGFNRLLLGVISRSRWTGPWEGLRLAVAQGVALFAVHPYVRSAILGAGDAMSYSLMVADFREQWRAGIFPILVGQSRFVFNGGFQPIRNAPYFQHLAWVFDLLSLGTLNAFALQNLTVIASMLGGVLGCYAALRLSLEKGAWLSLGLAVLYGLCPGVLAPLYGGDMYLTFMAVPFIPWLVLGLQQASASTDRLWPWALQGAALAGIWLAHPPVAAWATVVAAANGLGILLRERSWGVPGRMAVALAVLLVLSAYLFASVGSLGLPVVPRAAALDSIDFKLATLREDWVHSFLPVDPRAGRLMGDIQLGYGLWACMLLTAAAAARMKSGRALLGGFVLILVFAWPVPVLSRWAWRSLPSELLVVTNQWPAERFYVLLPAMAVFIAAPVLGRYATRGAARRSAVAVLVLLACLWSAAETWKFFGRAAEIRHSEGASEALHLPENITVSRTHSYEYLGTPAYYSNGHMDPRLETRLIDGASLRVFADGATSRLAPQNPIPGSRTLVLHRGTDGISPERFHVGPREAFVLRFDFLGRRPEGELQIAGGSLYNFYSLPQSGMPLSFGSGPGASHTLIVEDSTRDADDLSFRLVGTQPDGAGDVLARVSAEPLSPGDRVIRLESLTPFRAAVAADRDCYLETPKLYIPGYGATVDGTPARVMRSANGLVAVRLGAGEHEVGVTYLGGRLLRWSYAGSGAAWLLLMGLVGAYAFQVEQIPGSRAARRLWLRAESSWGRVRRSRHALAAGVILAAAAATAVCARFGVFSAAPHGNLHLLIRLPLPEIGRSEPLLTTGRQGAGDFIFVTYIDGGHVVVGHDKWSFGGGRSAPIAVDFREPQRVEIGLSSLDPAPGHPAKVAITWNGVLVYGESTEAFPSRPGDVTVGENTIGGSSTLPRFSGEILGVSRGDAVPP